MMDMLSQYVRTLAVFMIFASVCQIVMPEGSFKGAISLITGIMLMLIILKPVNAVLNADKSTWFNTDIDINGYNTAEEIVQYDEAGTQAVIDGFENACEQLLLSKLGDKADYVSVHALNGSEGVYIDSVTVYTSSGDAVGIASAGAELCGIAEDKVTVISGGMDEYNEADK